METAMFFRNVLNYAELHELTSLHKGITCPYRIISRINLGKMQYKEFCSNFMKGQSFLCAFIDTSKVYGDMWNCILVEHESAPSILVMSNGYQYPRFVAIFNQK